MTKRRFASVCLLLTLLLSLAGQFLNVDFVPEVRAGDFYADTGSAEDIQDAVDEAESAGGGTVHIPSGTYYWSVGDKVTYDGEYDINITGYSLAGCKGHGDDWESYTATTIIHNNAAPPRSGQMFYFGGNGHDPLVYGSVKIFNIQFEATPPATTTAEAGGYYDAIRMRQIPDFRISYCSFINFCSEAIYVTAVDTDQEDANVSCYGVVDHCYFTQPYKLNTPTPGDEWFWGYGLHVIGVDYYFTEQAPWWSETATDFWGQYGFRQWASIVYIEDCHFEYWRHGIVARGSGYYVSRFNLFEKPACGYTAAAMDVHGPAYPGGRGAEYYNNTIIGASENKQPWYPYYAYYTTAIGPRGGHNIIFNNTFTCDTYSSYNYFVLVADDNYEGREWQYLNYTYIWDNSYTGCSFLQNVDPAFIHEDKEYFLRAPNIPQDGFEYTSYTYPHPSVEEEEEEQNTVTLNNPANDATVYSLTIDFKFTPIFYQAIQNASLWTNETSWSRKHWNSTVVANNTLNTISETFSSEGTYIWNIEVFNSTHSVFGSSNWTFTITINTFGKTDIGSNTYGAADQKIYLSDATLTEDCNVTEMSWYGNTTSGSVDMTLAIYNSSDGEPSGLKGTSMEVTVGTTLQWWNFTCNISLTAGDYWIGWNQGGTSSVNYYYDDVAGAGRWTNDDYDDGFPNPIGSMTSIDKELSVYCTYTSEQEENSVVLNQPSDTATLRYLNVKFNYTTTFYQGSIVNSSLWLNITGTWQRVGWNTTAIETSHTIDYTFSEYTTYIWNVEVFNSTTSHFAASNYTVTLSFTSIVGISANPWITTASFQRKSFYASGRYWVFYANSTAYQLVYKTSVDGQTWTSETPIEASNYGPHISVFYDGTYVHYARTGYGTQVYYKRGLPNADGSISWSAAEQPVSTAYDSASNPHICVDTNGYAWIGYREYVGGVRYPYVIKSGNNDGTWGTTPSGFPYQLSTESYDTSTVSPIALTDGKVAVIYTGHDYGGPYGDKIHIQAWNGTDWLAVANSTSDAYHSMFYSAVEESDYVHITFMNYSSGNPLDILYVKYTYSTNSFGTETNLQSGIPQLDDGTDYCAPIISRTEDNRLYVFWGFYPTDAHIYYREWNGTVWKDRVDWIDETTDGFPNDHTWTCYRTSANSEIGVLYLTGSDSPYYIKFAILDTPPDYPPTYNNVGFNTTLAGAECKFSVKLYDSNGNVSGYIFSTNNTGSYQNETWTSIGASVGWANVTKTLNDTVGVKVRFAWYFNDTDNLWSNTGFWSLTTTSGGINSLELVSPDDAVNQTENSATFTFIPFFTDSIENASIWLNISGTWQFASWNTTNVVNNTNNELNFNFGAYPSATYIWNIRVYNTTNGIFAPSNRTINVQIDPVCEQTSYNSTTRNSACKFSAVFSDTDGLSGYIFSSNNTGSWTNQTWTAFINGNANWTLTLNETYGTVVQYYFYGNDSNNHWTSSSLGTLTTTYIYWMFNFNHLDLQSNVVDSIITWELWNSTELVSYVETEMSIHDGTYTLKTYYESVLINATDLDTEVYGNTTITIYLSMSLHSGCDSGGYIGFNSTLSSLEISSQTPTNITYVATGSGVYTAIISGIPRNATSVKKDDVIQEYSTVWTWDGSNIIIVSNLSVWEIIIPTTGGGGVGGGGGGGKINTQLSVFAVYSNLTVSANEYTKIEGHLQIASGSPMNNRTVCFLGSWGYVNQTQTDENGYFSIGFTAPSFSGEYELTLTFDGDATYNPSAFDTILTVIGGLPSLQVSIPLLFIGIFILFVVAVGIFANWWENQKVVKI